MAWDFRTAACTAVCITCFTLLLWLIHRPEEAVIRQYVYVDKRTWIHIDKHHGKRRHIDTEHNKRPHLKTDHNRIGQDEDQDEERDTDHDRWNHHRNGNGPVPTPDMVRAAGYPAETHHTTTADGYILALHRIPRGKEDGTGPLSGAVCYLQHGLMVSSADWVIPTPKKGFGFILADAGCDVWMGNFRGNTYSSNHTTLDPGDSGGKFWEYSWDEMAKYDIPAQVEKILEVTGKEKLFYIGHSMGTTTFMAMHHYRPDIAKKIQLGNLMAPVATVGHSYYFVLEFLNYYDVGYPTEYSIGGMIWKLLGPGRFAPHNWIFDLLAKSEEIFCESLPKSFAHYCQMIYETAIFLDGGFDYSQFNTSLVEPILSHAPAGTSKFTIGQYLQELKTQKFKGYDWLDEAKNKAHHQGEIPHYSLSNVSTPIAIYWGDNDWYTARKDVEFLLNGLPNIVPGMRHEVEYDNWSHLDFLWGVDADKLVYKFVIQNIEKCLNNKC